MEKQGNVFDIQRYSIHDGPGIRTVVFLKGCPLRCKWCSNPESWQEYPQLFYAASRCIGCMSCVENCPNGEVTAEDGLKIHWEKCRHENLQWTDVCPTKALSVKGKPMTTEEVFSEIMKDAAFYRRSNGGVTLSGGEPLLQADFAEGLLKMCKEEGIHTAVETTGFVSRGNLEKVLPYTNLFLYDLKSADSRVHKEWTGVDNHKIMENLQWLAGQGTDIFVRTPMIPGVNDKEQDILDIIEILQRNKICNYDILPFHQYGSAKYTSCGIEYTMQDVKAHEEEYVEKIRNMIRSYQLSTDMENRA
ncbi:glycyl-radical enzyme activating protein [Faecalicatena contorta]|uniref:Glycerol dehydratase, cobalamin-independent, small subunit n=1 Tax=Faecalicatena contorta TaxID=39482 RepID=A0A316A3J7_9FIRM|nr:glycyl-radical enzyme activating protein [Faecalicatena contorta]PWJ51858.1 cobalamin-independent glycerol dehydratase small subunit [Faecalicatena contorta]SUQ12109.1 glycerol dehydratase, cobalamin-independent, small subunit [Faecalicatena contorta]